jgi:hypothetical protein
LAGLAAHCSYCFYRISGFEGFDVSLLSQLHAGKGSESMRRGLLKGIVNDNHDDEHGLDAEMGGGTDESSRAAKVASHNELHQNQDQAVAPLAGVAVAVFSEGPEKAEKDQAAREAKYGEKGLAGKASDKIRDWRGERATGGLLGNATSARSPLLPQHDSASAGTSPVGGSSPLASRADYHPLPGESGRSRQSADSHQSHTQPVVTAGEITEMDDGKTGEKKQEKK